MAASKKQISRTEKLIQDLNTAVQKAEELNSTLAQNISDSKNYFEDIKKSQTEIKDILRIAKTDSNQPEIFKNSRVY